MPTKDQLNKAHSWFIGAVFVYQLGLLYHREHKLEINRALKPFLGAA